MPLSALVLLLASQGDPLLAGWNSPPNDAKLRAYWWWLNGNVTRESIRNDLEEMAKKGFGGAIITDANGASQEGNDPVPHGPTFMSKEWRELYKFTLQTANRLGLEMSLNIQSGWNLGGPNVSAEDAPKKLVWTDTTVRPGDRVALPKPTKINDVYHDLYVVAYPVAESYDPGKRAMLKNFAQKALEKPLSFSAPKTAFLLEDDADKPGEAAADSRSVIDLTSKMNPDGTIEWTPPSGRWEVLRIGWTLNDHRFVSTSSDGWKGYAIDPFDKGAFDRYWNSVVEPLIADAGQLAGKTLRYLHTDSWEVEVANWTPTLREEFRARRGYDPFSFLPILAGRILDSRSVSNRFLNDVRRTMGDLAIDHHFRPFKEYSARHGLMIHPESGGPHAVPIDSIQCLGMDDAPMSEFWASSWMHRVKEEDRFFVKQPASAAHVYDHNLVLAEGFTSIGPHWQERLADNLKPNFEKALCEGLNRLVWHAFVNSPASAGLPGQQYFAGTHLNPQTTWWNYGKPFFDYLNRCQFMMQQGKPVADVLYYYGDHVPNFAQLKKSDPAHVRPGYDYDVITLDALVNRISVRNGRLVTPDGLEYHVLVLPKDASMSLVALRKIRDLVQDGATVVGPPPHGISTLSERPAAAQEFAQIVRELWSVRKLIRDLPAIVALKQLGVEPDFLNGDAFSYANSDMFLNRLDNLLTVDWVHRKSPLADAYFVTFAATYKTDAKQEPVNFEGVVSFRCSRGTPELWNPVTGERFRAKFTRDGDKTDVVIPVSPGCSWFVVFRNGDASSLERPNQGIRWPRPAEAALKGPWQVSFDPKWGAPAAIELPGLIDWTKHPNPGVRFYSGVAKYRKTFEFTWDQDRLVRHYLDLGDVREIAVVRLNGMDCGTVWTHPYRLDISKALRQGRNELEIEVVNFWPNRIIGDASLPPDKRFTRTNIRKLTAKTELMPSGLLGPVTIGP